MDHRGAVDDEVTDTGADPAGRGGWGVWVLLLAAVVPLAVVVAGSTLLLSGSSDDHSFQQTSTDENGVVTTSVQEGITFWDRWYQLWWSLSPGGALLAVAAVLVVVVVLQHAARPGWLLPGRTARRVGSVVGALTTIAAAVVVGLALVGASRPVDGDGMDWYRSGSLLHDVGNLGLQSLLATALAGLATVALVRPGVERGEHVVRLPDDGPPEQEDVADGGDPGGDERLQSADTPRPAAAPAVPDIPAAPPVPVSFPRAEDPALYRRPSA